MNYKRMLAITSFNLKQLQKSPDFWIPMMIMGILFFVVLPAALLLGVTFVQHLRSVKQVGDALGPITQVTGKGLQGKPEAYGLAVHLFAPLAVVVPMTICSAIGANTLVGERERGTGEFLAHCPATEREIYLGKLIASLLPGYAATVIGFGLYSLVVNLIFWLIPPFLALALSMILRVSGRVKTAAAAQQSSGLVTLPLILLTYGQSSGTVLGGAWSAVALGAVAWVLAIIGLWRGARAVTRPRLLGIDNV
jgi:ABC-type Na+ efflux pump permease subunit